MTHLPPVGRLPFILNGDRHPTHHGHDLGGTRSGPGRERRAVHEDALPREDPPLAIEMR
jgi:hypothetical protein